MKVTLKILLSVAIIVLAYMCYRSIMTPIEFNNEKEARDNAIIARLIEIRKAQYHRKHDREHGEYYKEDHERRDHKVRCLVSLYFFPCPLCLAHFGALNRTFRRCLL